MEFTKKLTTLSTMNSGKPLLVLRQYPGQEMPGQGFVSTSVCKLAATLVAAVEAAFAQGADTLLA